MKKSLLIFVLFALPFVHFLAEANAETTSMNQTYAVDWETVNWKEKTYPNSNPLSPEDAETMWKRIQKEPQFQALPQVFKDLIEHNKDRYSLIEGDVNTFSFDNKQISGRFFYSPLIDIAFNNRFGLYVQILKLKAMKFIDEPVETPAVNPKTKRPYVALSNATLRSLKGDDLAYVKAFTETVNRNIHYLGSSPIPRLDMKRVKQGEYIGMAFWPLSLVQPKAFFESDKTKQKRFNKKAVNKTHTQLVEYFAKGDEEVYRLQDVLGTPLYEPRAFAPEAGRHGFATDCYGYPTPEFLEVHVVSLEYAAQVTTPERVLPFAYKRYFEAVVASCNLFKTGMESELNALDKKSPRGRAVNEVVKQAEKYLSQLEKAAAKCIENADKVYLNPPKTLLTAK